MDEMSSARSVKVRHFSTPTYLKELGVEPVPRAPVLLYDRAHASETEDLVMVVVVVEPAQTRKAPTVGELVLSTRNRYVFRSNLLCGSILKWLKISASWQTAVGSWEIEQKPELNEKNQNFIIRGRKGLSCTRLIGRMAKKGSNGTTFDRSRYAHTG